MIAPATHATSQGPVLRDIHLPPAPSWWPPAPGWWVLALLCILATIAGAWVWRRHRRRRAAEHAVLAELDAIVEHWQAQPSRLAAAMHQLLRRVALRHDRKAGQRQGEAWRETLALVPVPPATVDRLMALELLMYRSDPQFDVQASIEATREWLRAAWRLPPLPTVRSPRQGRAHA